MSFSCCRPCSYHRDSFSSYHPSPARFRNYEKTYGKDGSLKGYTDDKDDFSFRTSESGSSEVDLNKPSQPFDVPDFAYDPEAGMYMF